MQTELISKITNEKKDKALVAFEFSRYFLCAFFIGARQENWMYVLNCHLYFKKYKYRLIFILVPLYTVLFVLWEE